MLKPPEIRAAERGFFTVLAEHVSTLLWLFYMFFFPVPLVLCVLPWHLNGQLMKSFFKDCSQVHEAAAHDALEFSHLKSQFCSLCHWITFDHVFKPGRLLKDVRYLNYFHLLHFVGVLKPDLLQ